MGLALFKKQTDLKTKPKAKPVWKFKATAKSSKKKKKSKKSKKSRKSSSSDSSDFSSSSSDFSSSSSNAASSRKKYSKSKAKTKTAKYHAPKKYVSSAQRARTNPFDTRYRAPATQSRTQPRRPTASRAAPSRAAPSRSKPTYDRLPSNPFTAPVRAPPRS